MIEVDFKNDSKQVFCHCYSSTFYVFRNGKYTSSRAGNVQSLSFITKLTVFLSCAASPKAKEYKVARASFLQAVDTIMYAAVSLDEWTLLLVVL